MPDSEKHLPAERSLRAVTIRYATAAAIGLPVLAYLLLVLCWPLPAERRLGVAELALLLTTAAAIGIILRPELLRDVKEFSFGTMKITLERKLEQQQQKLNQVELIMTLLMEQRKRDILKGLANDGDFQMKTSNELFNDLLYLRGMQLITNVLVPVRRHLGETMPGNVDHKKDIVNLEPIVSLTSLGKQYAAQLIAIDKQAEASADKPMS